MNKAGGVAIAGEQAQRASGLIHSPVFSVQELSRILSALNFMPKHILSISYDRSLLWTRQLLLEQFGYRVSSAEGFAQAWEAAENEKNNFDLIILGHSIPPKDKQAIISHLRASCDCAILALLRPYESPVPEAAMSIDAGDPKALIDEVGRMLKGSK